MNYKKVKINNVITRRNKGFINVYLKRWYVGENYLINNKPKTVL